jgi:MYXO-CTERM domain-containing protein
MPFRRTFTAAALALALAGTFLPPASTDAQIGSPATAPSESQPHRPPDVGWLGLLGLVGLFGLFGTRADRTMR